MPPMCWTIHLLFLFMIHVECGRVSKSPRNSRFVRLPSGYTFPADAASNFQHDAYVAATFSPPSEKILQSPPRYNAAESYPSSDSNTLKNASPAPTEYGSYVAEKKGESYQTGPPVDTIPPITTAAPPAMPTEPSVGPQTTPATMGLKKANIEEVTKMAHSKFTSMPHEGQLAQKGHTYTALGGGQFYQSLLGGKSGFSPLSFFLNGGLGGGGNNNGFFVPVPIVIPPPPPPPPGPKCFTNPSGFLCCNVTLEKTMEEAYIEAKSEGISLCNVQKMASAVQEKAEKKFGTSFESIAAHKDFVAKINFGSDLNCKIEIDGKFILAYATPIADQEVNIVDANSFFSGNADAELSGTNGTKPTYIVYGPIK